MSEKNINPIANYLLAKGFDKNAIIGALINMGQESGWSPYSDENRVGTENFTLITHTAMLATDMD